MSNPCVCLICKKGPMHGVTVHRVNEKGVPGVWVCDKHIHLTDAPRPDAEMKKLLRVIEKAGK